MEKLTGLIAAPFTPLDKNGDLALDQVKVLAQLYKRNKVSGAFVAGTTGEGPALTLEEKKQLMASWAELDRGALRIIFMLGGTCIKDMQNLASYAVDQGMDAVAVLSPYYFKPSSVTTLVDFCAEVAMASPNLPLYFYHIPGLSGGHFSMLEFLQKAEDKIPNLAGVKFSSPNIVDFHACSNFKNGKYDLLWGTDEAMLSALAVGCQGFVGSTYNYAAPLYHQIIDSFKNNDLLEAERLQYLAVQMVQLLVKYGGISAGKAFMKLIGVDCGWFRSPIEAVSDESCKGLKKEVDSLGFFDFCSKL